MESVSVENFEVRSDTEALAVSIIDVLNVAKKHGVLCWLNYGALLGMVREGRLLPWNNDAELCCWHESEIRGKLKRTIDELQSMGYITCYYAPIGTINIKKKGVDINVNCYWEEDGMAVRPHEEPSTLGRGPKAAFYWYWLAMTTAIYIPSVSFNRFRKAGKREFIKIILVRFFGIFAKKTRVKLYSRLMNRSKRSGGKFMKTGIASSFFKDFSEIDFYGGKATVPVERTELLAYIYGEGWKIPKEQWSFYAESNKSETSIKFIDESWDYNHVDIL